MHWRLLWLEECQIVYISFVNLQKHQFKRQSIYLGPKNCNSGRTDSDRKPNNVPITGKEFRVYGKKEENEVRRF